MAYTEAKVLAGGLAHIPLVIGFFGLIQLFILNNTKQGKLAKAKGTTPLTKVKAPEKAATSSVKPIKKADHSNIPVNTYRPKTPCL